MDEGYHPTPVDYEKAEGMLTDDERDLTQAREKVHEGQTELDEKLHDFRDPARRQERQERRDFDFNSRAQELMTDEEKLASDDRDLMISKQNERKDDEKKAREIMTWDDNDLSKIRVKAAKLKEITKEEFEQRRQDISNKLFGLAHVLVEKYQAYEGGNQKDGMRRWSTHGWKNLQELAGDYQDGTAIPELDYHDEQGGFSHGLQFKSEKKWYRLGNTITQDLISLLSNPDDRNFVTEMLRPYSEIQNATKTYNEAKRYLDAAGVNPKNPEIFQGEG